MLASGYNCFVNKEELLEELVRMGIRDPRVLKAIAEVPLDAFVPPELRHLAWENRPLPIGSGQTISQPYIVARMTELLRVFPGAKVLEIGTGSGYQAAVLAELGARVFSVERIPDLALRAAETLSGLGYDVKVRVGDGTEGWPEEAPFDRIIITAAAPRVPEPLLEQLAEGGVLVAPLGDRWLQHLTVIEKRGGKLRREVDIPCAFVPLVGKWV